METIARHRTQPMSELQSLSIDFAKEKEEGYRRVFSRSPLISSISAEWDGIYFTYDYLPQYKTPEVFAKQHGIAIFTEMPIPARAERTLDGQFRREHVTQGDILIVPANVGHRAGWDITGGVILIGFEPELVSQASWDIPQGDRLELLPHFATPDPLVCQIGLALKTVLEQWNGASRLYVETMSHALIVHLLQYYSAKRLVQSASSGQLPKTALQRVIDYINEYLDRDLSLKELAAVAQLSPHYFAQLFKQSTRLTPHQYVIRCRIERAKALLIERNSTIAEAARRVGFVDQSHLHRHFKRLVGVTPKAYLNQRK